MIINHIDLLQNALEELKVEIKPQTLEKFTIYRQMVMEWNEKINLTSIIDERDFIIKHFIDSIVCVSHPKMGTFQNIIDIGTGAGFPGIPLSIILPDKQFLLVDSLNKKINFLTEVIQKLNLSNVKVLHGRAEDLGKNVMHREKYDLCLSRAVAKLNVLSEYCLPFVKIGGTFAAYKSSQVESEIRDSQKAIRLLGGKIEKEEKTPLSHFPLEHQIIYIQKITHTPLEYPRKAGNPIKTPLK